MNDPELDGRTTLPADQVGGETIAESPVPVQMGEKFNGGEATPPKTREEQSTILDQFRQEVSLLKDLIIATQERLGKVEAVLEGAMKQVAFLPPQIRILGNKVDGLATAISEPRVRALLLGTLGLHDLVEQMLRTCPTGPDAEAGYRGNLLNLRLHLRQLLAANGLEEIATDGKFNPAIHRAVQRVPCANPAQEDHVVEVIRSGFRTEQAVLRYAEVLVGQYTPPAAEGAAADEKVQEPPTEMETPGTSGKDTIEDKRQPL